MMANDMPSFPSNPSYNAEAELDDLEKGLGYQISLDDRGSPTPLPKHRRVLLQKVSD